MQHHAEEDQRGTSSWLGTLPRPAPSAAVDRDPVSPSGLRPRA